MAEYPDVPVTDDEGRTYDWWGVCLTCGAEPHAPDPDDPDFGQHREGCPNQGDVATTPDRPAEPNGG